MPDFTKGKIYKITNDFNNDIYIGSTCNILTKRFSHHKAVISTEQQRPLYKLMAGIGFERFRIELIENYPCKDKYELRQREGHYIREMAWNFFFSISFAVCSITLLFHKSFGGTLIFLEATKRGS